MVNNVMQGYNACCLAYGQTGAGKTHTILGDLRKPPAAAGDADEPAAERTHPGMGLAPRLFHRIFEVRRTATVASLCCSFSLLVSL